jgi:hypothetical protein
MSKIEKAFKIKSGRSGLSISAGDTIDVPSTCYFGLDMQDRINGTTSRFGVYSFEMHINETPYFSLAMDKISFDETRYANAFMDCGEKERVNRYVSRLYVMPNNRLNIYKYALDNGVVHVPKGETVKVNMYLTDDSKNVSELKFWARGTGDNPGKTRLDKKNIAYWDKTFTLELPAFKMEIPAGALYESSPIEVKALGTAHGSVSQVYQVIKPETPPHRSVSIGIRASIPKKLWTKIAIVCMDKKGNKSALKTSYSAPYFMADTRSWGYFFIELDTTPPVVSPMNFIPNTTLKESSIKLKVFDNLSSLKSFGGYIDGEWALFDYDEKSNTMTYEIDSTRIKHRGEHDIRFIATDMLDNSTEFKCSLHF